MSVPFYRRLYPTCATLHKAAVATCVVVGVRQHDSDWLTGGDAPPPPPLPSSVSVNPCTALRMMRDFVTLSPGDSLVQNGANSAVGEAVIQLARVRGIRTINLIRERPGHEAVADQLRALGADVVLTEATVRSAEGKAAVTALPPPRLGLNCVGGKAAGAVARLLAPSGTLVTYGGMSKEPLQLPTGEFIFRDLVARGFWLSRWTSSHSEEEREQMLDSLWPLLRSHQLRPPELERTPLEEAVAAVGRAAAGGPGRRKTLLVMDG